MLELLAYFFRTFGAVTTAVILIVLVAFVAIVAYIQVGVWNECRVDHSFFYCVNLINHR